MLTYVYTSEESVSTRVRTIIASSGEESDRDKMCVQRETEGSGEDREGRRGHTTRYLVSHYPPPTTTTLPMEKSSSLVSERMTRVLFALIKTITTIDSVVINTKPKTQVTQRDHTHNTYNLTIRGEEEACRNCKCKTQKEKGERGKITRRNHV